MKKMLQNPCTLAFAAFILLFSLWDTQVTGREFSDFENRFLQQQPRFTWKRLFNNSYTKDYETFINDQFVLRDDWIALKSVAEASLGKTENNGVVFGRDGYLFEKYQKLPEEQLAENMREIRTFLARYPDLPVTFAPVPNAYAVLRDKLPLNPQNVDQLAVLSDLRQQVGEETEAKPLDMGAALAPHSGEYIYYRTDHHWTTLGAYYGYVAYAESLGKIPVPLEELEEAGVEVPGFYGTLFSKAKRLGSEGDTLTYYPIPATHVEIDGQAVDGYYDLPKLAERDKYAAFLRGNNSYTVLTSGVNRDGGGEGPSKVLLIKDSYGNSFAPFLLYHFDEVHIVDLRFEQRPLGEILAENTFEDVILLYNFVNLASDTNLYRLSGQE